MSHGARPEPAFRQALRAGVLTAAALATSAASSPVGAAAREAIPVAVLGDSDSHSYRDALNGVARGGANHARTFNWLEVWARLRPEEIDPGPFARAGEARSLAGLKALIGRPARAPRKDDYLYNYAWSGAGCASLRRKWPQQTRWLLARLKSDPARWARGLVVIRIGVNDFGQGAHLAALARDPHAMDGAIDSCLGEVDATVAAIRAVSPAAIALIGIAHDYETPLAGPEIVPDAALAAVAAALARFDDGLMEIAAGDRCIAFAGDRAWLTRRFGTRADGSARAAAAIAGLVVRNAVGDGAEFLHTADGHDGTIASGLFLQDFIAALDARLGWSLTPPSDEEIVALARG